MPKFRPSTSRRIALVAVSAVCFTSLVETLGCSNSSETSTPPPVVVVHEGPTPAPSAPGLTPGQKQEVEQAKAKGAALAANAQAEEKEGAKQQTMGSPKPPPQAIMGHPTPFVTPMSKPTPAAHAENRSEAPGSKDLSAEQAPPPKGQ